MMHNTVTYRQTDTIRYYNDMIHYIPVQFDIVQNNTSQYIIHNILHMQKAPIIHNIQLSVSYTAHHFEGCRGWSQSLTLDEK